MTTTEVTTILFIFLAAIPTTWVRAETGSRHVASTYYWKTRRLDCRHIDGNATRCVVRLADSPLEHNPGCFEELDKRNETRVYCRLWCDESDEATVLAKRPSWNHRCATHFTYHLERRRRDWYIWRSGACLTQTISFEFRCGFHRDPRVFYQLNQVGLLAYGHPHCGAVFLALFDYEDAEPDDVVPPFLKRTAAGLPIHRVNS